MVLAQHILSLTVLEESGWMVPKKQIPSCFLSSMENIKVKERRDCSDAACLMLCRWMLLMWVHCNETTTSWGPDEILRAHLCAVTGFISLLLAAQPCRACFWACLHAGCINTSRLFRFTWCQKQPIKGNQMFLTFWLIALPVRSSPAAETQHNLRKDFSHDEPECRWTLNPQILLYSSILTN